MNDPMLPLPGLSPVGGKRVVVNFDGGLLSSDGGILVLREVEQRLRVADRMAACLVDPRAPDQITHTLAAIIAAPAASGAHCDAAACGPSSCVASSA
jgi:Transposase DDE domain group 1